MRTRPVSVSTSTSAPVPATIQNGVISGDSAGLVIRRDIIGLIAAAADDVAGLHAVFFDEQAGDRRVAAFRLADLAAQRVDLAARVLGGEPHRVAHVEQRARAERAHVVGRDVGIAGDDPAPIPPAR